MKYIIKTAEDLVASREQIRASFINNKGVLQIVSGYFTELTFIYTKLFCLRKSVAKVAFVIDNVCYSGEVISVDFIYLFTRNWLNK
ncbi:MAG: hypothetical protein LBH04_08065 [Tannerellaceae bacterium]|jgi:hypothetical protein|nr:hypothetical protein [Tannerellaceae bacterium]